MRVKQTEKYDMLLESAKQIFAKKGFHSTKIKDITENANLATGTFYLYFKNKYDILDELFKQNLNHLLACFEEIDKCDISAQSKVEALLEVNIKYFYEERDFFCVYLEHSSVNDRTLPFKKNMEYINKFHSLLERMLQQGQQEGLFREDIDTKVVARSFRGMILLNIISVVIHEEYPPTGYKHLVEHISKIFLKGVLK